MKIFSLALAISLFSLWSCKTNNSTSAVKDSVSTSKHKTLISCKVTEVLSDFFEEGLSVDEYNEVYYIEEESGEKLVMMGASMYRQGIDGAIITDPPKVGFQKRVVVDRKVDEWSLNISILAENGFGDIWITEKADAQSKPRTEKVAELKCER